MSYFPAVKFHLVIALLIASGWLASSHTNDATLDVGGLLDAALQFAQDNLDPDVLQALQTVDRPKVEDFLKNYQDYLQGDYVLDVAQLKDAAITILPLLDAHEETQPYAAWLRERLDYFEAADEMKALNPPPSPIPGTNAPPHTPNPSFAVEQQVWVKKVAPRPWPK